MHSFIKRVQRYQILFGKRFDLERKSFVCIKQKRYLKKQGWEMQ